MKVGTARKVINSDKLARHIAKARGSGDYLKVKKEARNLITRINKRERRRKANGKI